MGSWACHILRGILTAALVVTMAACGGIGTLGTTVDLGGGSGAAATPVDVGGDDSGEAAPSGGGAGSPVAVEIPSLGDVDGLPFASAVVISPSSSISAALKAVPRSWVYKTFNLTTDTFAQGDSRLACEYRNSAGIAWGAMSLPDEALCLIKSEISSFTTPYDGSYHIMSTGATFPGVSSKIKFRFIRDSNNIITDYEEFACDSTSIQITYTTYSIVGTSLSAALKSIRTQEPQRSYVTLSGTLDSDAQFTAKSGAYSYTGSNDFGALEGAMSIAQGVDYLLLDAFDSRGDGANISRIYGQATQTNTSSPFAVSGYTYGAGAANFIGSDLTSTECWNGTTNDPEACAGSNYAAITGKTPKVVTTQTVSSFSGGSAWDCSGTVEVNANFTMSEMMASSSCFSRFGLDSDYIDCATATQGSVTVTPSVGGTTLSTNSSAPTIVSATPTILVTGSRALDSSSANSATVTLVKNSNNDSVTLTYENNWNSDNTVLTLSPTLVGGNIYKLTLVGSSSVASRGTVIRTPSGSPPADQMQSTGTYYIGVLP